MAGSYNELVDLLENAINAKHNLVNTLVGKGEEATFDEPLNDLIQKAGEYIPKSYIFVDENGNEIPGVLVDHETVFTATANDIREGKVAASALGVVVGEKDIPNYYTREGYSTIPAKSSFILKSLSDLYDFTKFQALICPYNGNMSTSVAVEKVAINEHIYAANDTELIATITKDAQNKWVNFNITNTSGKPYIIRYFTYKEID